MCKDPKQPKLAHFRIAAFQLLANKLFVEFITTSEKFPVEPEHFFECWVSRNVIKPDEQLKVWVWRYFMDNLLDFRKFKRSK